MRGVGQGESNGLQWSGYKKLQWGCVDESACADSWGRALSTGEPSLSIPCFAERRYGGVMEDELLMALPPRYLPKIIEGLAQSCRPMACVTRFRNTVFRAMPKPA